MRRLEMSVVGLVACALAGIAYAQVSDPVFGSIGCGYALVPAKDRASINPNSPEAKAVKDKQGTLPLSTALGLCGQKNRWDKMHSELASRYAVSRVDFEAAEEKLVAAGVARGQVAAAWAALSEDDRAIILAKGLQAPEVLPKAYAELGKVGAQSEQGLVTLAHFANIRRFEADWMAAKDNKPAAKPNVRVPYVNPNRRRL